MPSPAVPQFQSTHPRRVRRGHERCVRPLPRVSIHAPAKGATPSRGPWRGSRACFNPRTREGCDCRWSPRRSATSGFNPRTREGCDRRPYRERRGRARCFNPRTREGCDLGGRGGNADRHQVSIHAPAKGATPLRRRDPDSRQVSIHAPAKGATVTKSCRGKVAKFQSTHPRRVRQAVINTALGVIQGFNPRTREGCDVRHVRGPHGLLVSIHAPAKGATSTASRAPWRASGFNPRTREGCDYRPSQLTLLGLTFQSTHPRRVRRP